MEESDLVWNAITDSAKRRFDYKSFAEDFNEINDNIADNLLFKIIVGFVEKKESKIISLELFNDMMMTGFIWKLEDIQSFVEGKDKVFGMEILASRIAVDLLQNGNDAASVLIAINQFLN